MKKLLYQFDTDTLPSVFDNVVAYDGGADHISAYGGVNAKNVGGLVEGAIFTRGLKDGRSLAGKRAVVLGGSGPVGQRAAVLLAREGADVAITGRKRDVVQAACDSIHARYGIVVEAVEAPTNAERGAAIEGAQIVLATGAAGVTLLDEKQWQNSPALELIADANASPPAGIEGVGQNDRGLLKHGKILFGSLGFGALKLALHRACVARLFEQNDLILDAEEIYAIAKTMVG